MVGVQLLNKRQHFKVTITNIIDKYYPAGCTRRVIYIKHCRQVTDLAIEIAHRKHLPLTDEKIEEAAMLHDIGIFLTDAPDIGCNGKEPYIMHGVLGGKLLREEGLSEETNSRSHSLPVTICRRLCWNDWYAMPINSILKAER